MGRPLPESPMPDPILSNSAIVNAYREKTPGSEKLALEAIGKLPSGIAHDGRYLKPYGLYIEKAAGPRKWDVDGNPYIDYFGGHGALLLGHNNPDVIAAVHATLDKGTHFGANHPLEVEWASQVCRMVPCAERVRFTSSGTEATLMALRLARAFTGKSKLLRFRTMFHGWHDHMTSGYANHFDGTPTVGVVPGIADEVVLVEPMDVAGLKAALAAHDDIAVAIVEPTGSSFGQVPFTAEFCRILREETAKAGVLLIFDEVITGFRCSPGGAQQAYGVTPDLTTLAKIIAGGLPGGAVVGRADILENLDFDITDAKKREKIQHPGTFNANPVSAAAGITALRIIETTDACDRANAAAAALRDGMNAALEAADVAWAVYGTFSSFHVFSNPKGLKLRPSAFDPLSLPYTALKEGNKDAIHKLRLALAVNGVDLNSRCGGMTSATHTDAEIAQTVDAFAESLRMLKRDGEL
jgi:glutamate-1-semialdehyde 2,1-aminomutase